MRALSGAIIAAGAMIGLGMTAIGVGTRYQNWATRDTPAGGEPHWVKFTQMDSTLIGIVTLLVIAAVVGIGLAFVGLAYHHHRRHHELFGTRAVHDTGTRVPTP